MRRRSFKEFEKRCNLASRSSCNMPKIAFEPSSISNNARNSTRSSPSTRAVGKTCRWSERAGVCPSSIRRIDYDNEDEDDDDDPFTSFQIAHTRGLTLLSWRVSSTPLMIANPKPLPPPRLRVPEWIRVNLPTTPVFAQTATLVEDLKLHTVCESAKCPNRWECWNRGTATFMIAGDRCTRACGFCAVTTAKPFALEIDEPQRVAEAARRMKLEHVVVTAVARDDLSDGGAAHFARTIRALRQACEKIVVEVLTPDFNGDRTSLQTVIDAQPDVFNHNLETVRRLTPSVRSRARYDRSLEVLATARAMDPDVYTKSGIMLGLGETETEIM